MKDKVEVTTRIIRKGDLEMYLSWGYKLQEEFIQMFTDKASEVFCKVYLESF